MCENLFTNCLKLTEKDYFLHDKLNLFILVYIESNTKGYTYIFYISVNARNSYISKILLFKHIDNILKHSIAFYIK